MHKVNMADYCIAVGDGAGADMQEDRTIEINFAGIGMRHAVMTPEEWPHVRAVILRLCAPDLERARMAGFLIDTRSPEGKGDWQS